MQSDTKERADPSRSPIRLIEANIKALTTMASGTHRGNGSSVCGAPQFGIASDVRASVGLRHDTALRMTEATLSRVIAAGPSWLARSRSRQ